MQDAIPARPQRIRLRPAPPHWRIVAGFQVFTAVSLGVIGLAALVSGLAGLGPEGQIPPWQRFALGLMCIGVGLLQAGAFAGPSHRAVRRRDAHVDLKPSDLVIEDAGLFEAPLVIPRGLITGVAEHSGRVTERGLHAIRVPASISFPLGYMPPANATIFLSTAVPAPRPTSRFLNRMSTTSPDPGIRILFLWLESPGDVTTIREWLSHSGPGLPGPTEDDRL